MSMLLNGYQVDIQTIVLFNESGAQSNYQHIYYVRNSFSGNDTTTNCSAGSQCFYNYTDPCSSTPCKNGRTCFVGYYNDINCLCPTGFTGN
jgi:hypothetical protein